MIQTAELDHTLIFFSCFLSLTLLAKRTLNIRYTFGAFICALSFVIFDGHYIFGYIILPKGNNPQIATVGLLVFSFLSLGTVCLLKRGRTLDRIFVAGITTSVFATGLLFHFVLVQTVLPGWAKDAAWGNSYLVSVPIEDFKDRCIESKLECWDSQDLVSRVIEKEYDQLIYGMFDFYANKPEIGVVGHGIGSFNDLGENSVALILYHQAGADVRVIADSEGGRRVHRTVRNLFYLLSSVAHLVWLIGGLTLLFFHKKRFAMRNA